MAGGGDGDGGAGFVGAGGAGCGVVVAGAGATGADVVVTSGAGSVGEGVGEGDADGVVLGDSSVVAPIAGVGVVSPLPLIAATIAVPPPQHSTRSAAVMMPRVKASLPTFFFFGSAAGTSG